MTSLFHRSPCLRATLIAALAFTLAWQVLTRSLTASLAEFLPHAALKLRPWDAAALLALAEPCLSSLSQDSGAAPPAESCEANGDFPPTTLATKTRAVAERARSLAERALNDDPLNAFALRILGQVAEIEGDDRRAFELMQAAARRSHHESFAHYWLMRRSYERADFASAAAYADILMRTRSGMVPHLTPLLAQMAEREEGAKAVENLLAANPPWRAQFFSVLPASISDARTPLHLFHGVAKTAFPPTAEELRAYLDFLVAHGFYELAYYAWTQFLTPKQLSNAGLLFNGNFESAPSGLPFDWAISPGSGVIIDVVRRADDTSGSALFIEFAYGRVDFRGVRQLVLLAPGRHRFKGLYRGTLIGRRGLVWRIVCVGETQISIGESVMAIGVTNSWRTFEFEFTVPSARCHAQYVILTLDARSQSEQMVSGSLWYRGLGIERITGDIAAN